MSIFHKLIKYIAIALVVLFCLSCVNTQVKFNGFYSTNDVGQKK